MTEQIEDLQARIAFQEDTLEKLTRTVVEHQRMLHDVQAALAHLQTQITEMRNLYGEDSGNDQAPPHF